MSAAIPLSKYTLTQGFHASHQAIDMAVPNGTVYRAMQSGRVWQASWDGGGWAIGGGFAVLILHGDPKRPSMRTSYCHGQRLYVKPGQLVRKGQLLGECDNLGRTTGPHMHHDVQLWDYGAGKWTPVDPYRVYPAHVFSNGSSSGGTLVKDRRVLTSVKVTGSRVNLRQGYTTATRILATLSAGTILVLDGVVSGQKVDGVVATWHRVWHGSVKGYMYGGQGLSRLD